MDDIFREFNDILELLSSMYETKDELDIHIKMLSVIESRLYRIEEILISSQNYGVYIGDARGPCGIPGF